MQVQTLNYNSLWTFAITWVSTLLKPRQRPTVLDWAVYDSKKVVLQTSTANSVAGIKTALRLLKTLPDWKPAQAVFCMEHTATADRGHL